MTGIELIAKERTRQIEYEGYTLKDDLYHTDQGLALSAASYALPHEHRKTDPKFVGTPDLWPWDAEYWKPTPEDRVRELVKAGALIAAEIDRLNSLCE